VKGGDEVTLMDAEAYQFRQYRLSMILSGDARGYQLSLVPMEGCAEAWFGNQRGVIH
jgi:hypothetical protein